MNVAYLACEQKDLELESIELDREIGFDGSGFGSHTIHLSDEVQVEVGEESQFSISRLVRNSSLVLGEVSPLPFLLT